MICIIIDISFVKNCASASTAAATAAADNDDYYADQDQDNHAVNHNYCVFVVDEGVDADFCLLLLHFYGTSS